MRSSWLSRLTFDQRPLYGATAPAARPAQFGQERSFEQGTEICQNALLNDFVGAQHQRLGDCETKRLRGFQVDR